MVKTMPRRKRLILKTKLLETPKQCRMKESGTMEGAAAAVLLEMITSTTGENLVEVGNVKEFPGSYPKLTKDEIIYGTAMRGHIRLVRLLVSFLC